MKLATLTQTDGILHLRKSDDAYIADLKNALAFGLSAFLMFGGSGLAIWLLCLLVRHRDGTSPISPFLTPATALLLTASIAIVILVNLTQDFLGLLSPHEFTFDRDRDTLLVEGASVGTLTRSRLSLEDSFGTTHRVFRMVLITEGGRKFVLAQTPMFAPAVPQRFDYTRASRTERTEHGLWRWTPYRGATTGYNPSWPEYQQLFAFYTQMRDYVEGTRSDAAREKLPMA